MSSAAFPAVIAALIARANVVLPGVRAIRGQDISQDPSDAVLVGVRNVEDISYTSAGTFRQTMQSFGGNREEVGSVNCLVLAHDGNGDQDAATEAALGYLAYIEADVRADPTLGLTGYGYVVAEMGSGEILERQSDDGAATQLPFVIAYKIRI